MSKMKDRDIDQTSAAYRIDEWSRIFDGWTEAYRANTIDGAVCWADFLLNQGVGARIVSIPQEAENETCHIGIPA
jgi:hypothetical protein